MATTTNSTNVIGKPLDRVDGRLKVTGGATYAAEHPIPHLAHAVAVTSTISVGRIKNMDIAAAKSAPGVIDVITPDNAPKMAMLTRHNKDLVGQPGQTLPLLQDDKILYGGQYIAVVVAETVDQAMQAAKLIRVDYESTKPVLDIDHPLNPLVKPAKIGQGDKPDSLRGDPDAAFASAGIKIRQTYTTANETHNPMEMHATIAVWDDDRLTLYDSTQHVLGVKSVAAAILEIPQENIRVIAPFLGGGFGCKGSVWPHIPMAAIAAQRIGRPVKLVLTRAQMFTQVGYRPRTVQQISLGADQTGKLTSISHETVSQTSSFDEWVEPSSKQSKFLYSCPNVRTSHHIARLNVGTPCQMRAPGEATGTYGIEAAMDELAYAANIDPLELRLRNYAEKDEDQDKPWSSKALRECYQLGAEKFGWAKRTMAPRSTRDGRMLVGWGMATATYPTNQSESSAAVRLFPDGRAVVSAATHDLGTGQYTIMTQVAAETLGIPVEKVKFELGDTLLPKAPVAGGSQSAASVGNAVQAAAKNAIAKLARLATQDQKSPLTGKDPMVIVLNGDRLQVKDDPTIGEPIAELFRRNGNRPIEAVGQAKPGEDAEKFSKHAWGAQFAEVRVDDRLGEIRVSRFVGVFAGGRILNTKTARSQMIGGIVMAIGMALHETTAYDTNSGRVVNDNLADYLVPINADIPPIDVYFVDEVDPHINALGAKGLGELGITGAAAAVANAVFHATGKRVRDLPITLDTML